MFARTCAGFPEFSLLVNAKVPQSHVLAQLVIENQNKTCLNVICIRQSLDFRDHYFISKLDDYLQGRAIQEVLGTDFGACLMQVSLKLKTS